MTNQKEKEIVKKLKAQRANVQPPRALLTSILAQLPAEKLAFAPSTSLRAPSRQGQYFWWLRIAIPAGVALIIGIVFFNMQGEPEQVAQAPSDILQPQTIQQTSLSQPEEVLSFASLGAEEEEIEQVFAQQERILAETILMEEIPEQAQLEAQETYVGYEKQQQTVLEQVEISEENVVKIASQRATVIEEKLEELAREGKNVEELETLLADAQSKIEEANTLLHTIRENVHAEDADEATIRATRDTFQAARKNTRDVYETFRSIAREAKSL